MKYRGPLVAPSLPPWRSTTFALALALACGSGGGAPEAQSADDATAAETSESEADSGASEAGAETSSAQSESASGSACDDGTCFPCGDGICPAGWYCQDDAKNGAACSWLPDCAERGECGCITRVLGSGCACEQREGGAHVKCG